MPKRSRSSRSSSSSSKRDQRTSSRRRRESHSRSRSRAFSSLSSATSGSSREASSDSRDQRKCYPILGDLVTGGHELLYEQYHYVKELGKGTFSRVVEVVDLKGTGAPPHTHVALKVFRGTKTYEEACQDEYTVMSKLFGASSEESVTSTSGVNESEKRNGNEEELPIVQVLHFLKAPAHWALAYPLCGPSVFSVLDRNRCGFPLEMVRSIAYQLLQALAHAHRKGYIHTDLKPENIVFRTHKLVPAFAPTVQEVLSRKGMKFNHRHPPGMSSSLAVSYGNVGGSGNRHQSASSSSASNPFRFSSSTSRPHQQPLPPVVSSSDGRRRGEEADSSPPPTPIVMLPLHSQVAVIDFGSAVHHTETKKVGHNIQTRHYRAPEVLWEQEWSFPADLWSVGCIIAELITGEALFMTHSDIEHAALMERIISPVSERTLDKMFTLEKRRVEEWDRAHPRHHHHHHHDRHERKGHRRPSNDDGRADADADGDGERRGRSRRPRERMSRFYRLSTSSRRHYQLLYPERDTSRQNMEYVATRRNIDSICGHSLSDLSSLVYGLLTYDPEKRLTAEAALRHRFFTGVG